MKSARLALAALGALPFLAGEPARADDANRLQIKILSINDFHGNLKPPAAGLTLPDPADPTKTVKVEAGGSEAMATLVKSLRAKAKHSVFVAAGDLVGASPLLSALFADEPTIESLSLMGLEMSAVGNHEFDKGAAELLRKQKGGCSSDKACLALHPFLGAKFQYLAASTIVKDTGRTLLPPYEIKTFEGISVGFVGLALKGTPGVVSPSGVAGLEFRDEAETVNALVPELKAKGVEAIVVLIHEGGYPTGGPNECPSISGPIVDIVKRLDKAVDLVISGHTHKAYACVIDGRPVTSGDKFGSMVSEIDVEIDRTSRDVVSTRAQNLVVRVGELAKDADQTALIASYERVAQPLIEKPVARITASITKAETAAGETPLGNLIADAQLAATRGPDKGGAVIALTNPGGIRTDLVRTRDDGTVTYGDVFAVQPFSNMLVTVTLTGAQLHTVLEQQWLDQPKPRILQVSEGFAYAWSAGKPVGARVDPASMRLEDKPIDPKADYRVTINSFLADGGDGFKVFPTARDAVTGMFDVEALEAFLATAKAPVEPPKTGRIARGE
ncbi:MAG: bifunctional metallophosphatase/5'-nucleotidase [Siculibacillus sp.]